jgi:S1-C subfamily serine protease
MLEMIRIGLAILLISLLASCAPRNEIEAKNRIIRTALDSTVQLFTERQGGVTRAGSGVILGPASETGRVHVLTTAHLLEPVEEQSITALSPPHHDRLPVKLLSIDTDADLALLEVEGLPSGNMTLADSANLGDRIWVVAFPWGRERTVVGGVVSQIRSEKPQEDGRAALGGHVRLIDASVSYGMSGGGVFSQQTGQLLGLVRGYRSAELSFSGAQSGSLTLPVAGETTVISTPRIRCFLSQTQLGVCGEIHTQ